MGYSSTMIYLPAANTTYEPSYLTEFTHTKQRKARLFIEKVVSPTAVTAGDTTQGIAYLAD